MFVKFTIAALALIASAAPVVDHASKLPLPSRRLLSRANGEVDGEAVLASLNSTLHKYHATIVLPTFPTIPHSNSKRASNEALTDQVETGNEDELYYGPGQVGANAPQTFTFDFDTGSSDVFVPGPQCGPAQGCKAGTQYSQTGQDEHNTTSVTYGSGQITGENYFDSLSVAGLTATHQNIISLVSAQGFNTSDSNSLLGMGFSTIAQSKQPTYFENLIAQGKVTTQEFSFYLGRAKSSTQSRSELTLGGRDASRYNGAFTRVPVTTKGYWQVALDHVNVNGATDPVTAAVTAGQAAIDTGTTIVLAPTAAAAAIFARVPGSFPIPLVSGGEITFFAYPCASNPSIAPVFAGTPFAINPLDLNLGTLTSNFGTLLGNGTLASVLAPLTGTYCLAGVAGADLNPAENLYVVGDTFLKNWYSVYNYVNNNGGPSVSFAKAAGNQ